MPVKTLRIGRRWSTISFHYIGGEEEKSEQEPLRIWGHIENGEIVKAEGPVITTQCIRVPVLDGHTAAVFVTFEEGKKPSKEEIIESLERVQWCSTGAETSKCARSILFSILRMTTVLR